MTRTWIRRPRLLWLAVSTLAATGGCEDDSLSEERTLENCDTSIDGDAPAFFQDLYRCVDITSSTSSVTISTVNLPPHRSYYYGEDSPNYEEFDYSRGDQYQPNPNLLSEQDISITVPLEPTPKGITITGELVDGVVGTSDEEYPMGPAGVALDSVAIFNPLAAPGDDIEQEKYTFDSYSAHPQQDGQYHYHSSTAGPLEVLLRAGRVTSTTPGAAEVEIYGIMCDGTVILGCTEADGSLPADDLDAQGGHVHDVTDTSGTVWFADRYHAHVCETGRRFTPEIQYYDSCGITGGQAGPPQ